MARISWPGRSFQEAQPPKPWHHLQECMAKGIWFSGRIGGPPSCISVNFGVNLKWFFNKHSKTKVSPFCWVPIIVWKGIVCLFRQWLFLAVFVAFCVDPGGDPLDDFTRPQRLLRVVENERRCFWRFLTVFVQRNAWNVAFSKLTLLMDCNMDHRYSHIGGRVRFTWLQRLLSIAGPWVFDPPMNHWVTAVLNMEEWTVLKITHSN